MGVERERRRGRWCTRQHPERPRTRRLNSTNTPHTRPLRFLAGQRICTEGRCNAGTTEIPRLERRPVRVEGATGRPWGATAHRERAGRVRVVDSTYTVLMVGVMYPNRARIFFIFLSHNNCPQAVFCTCTKHGLGRMSLLCTLLRLVPLFCSANRFTLF